MHMHTDLQRHSLSRMLTCHHAIMQKRLHMPHWEGKRCDFLAPRPSGPATLPRCFNHRVCEASTLFARCLVVCCCFLPPLPSVNMEAWDKMPWTKREVGRLDLLICKISGKDNKHYSNCYASQSWPCTRAQDCSVSVGFVIDVGAIAFV